MFLVPLVGCGGAEAIPGTQVGFDLEGGIWQAPFPSEHLRREDGGVSLRGLPNPQGIELVTELRRLVERDADGFGRSSTVYFPLSAPLDASKLPTPIETSRDDAPVQLVDIDPSSPERGRRIVLDVEFLADPGPFGRANLLAALPLGPPMRGGTLYAAVLTRAVVDVAGQPLGVPLALRRLLLDGEAPAGRGSDTYLAAREGLEAVGLDLDTIAGLGVFRTGNPTRDLARFVEAIRRESPPAPSDWVLTDRFDAFCAFEALIEVPVYQRGEPPYSTRGGGWDLADEPKVVRTAPSRVILTLPRQARGALPTTVFIRTGGGGDRPLVDRGVRAEPGGEAISPGTGPALELARVGVAGLSWDGPHGGLRGDGSDEQFTVFNFVNPEALRDNVRQTALEVPWLLGLLDGTTITSTQCELTEARLDASRVALMGHSMGATIAPLAAAFEPRIQALLLSGAGGSWIQNVIHKERPIRVRPFAEILLDYDDAGRTLTEHDPALALLQWAGEPADPPLYASALVDEAKGRHILMMQGIEDRYIPPPVANALSWALGLDLGGPALDEGAFLTLSETLGLESASIPASGNAEGFTRMLTQHRQGPVEGGHEVVFQTDGPKEQYRCFLSTLFSGETPVVTTDCAP